MHGAAIMTAEVKKYTIKPLVWKGNKAAGYATEYEIHLRDASKSVFGLVRLSWRSYGGTKSESCGDYKSLEECKTAAQKDHVALLCGVIEDVSRG